MKEGQDRLRLCKKIKLSLSQKGGLHGRSCHPSSSSSAFDDGHSNPQLSGCHEADREFQVGGLPPQLGVEVCSLWPGLVSPGCEEGTVLQNMGWGLFRLCAGTQCRVGKVQSSLRNCHPIWDLSQCVWAELHETGGLSATLAVNRLGRCRAIRP